jgi:L-ribulose-5-phosphate 3-epimerase
VSKISLAGWSLNRRFRRSDHPLLLLDFPRVAKEEFGISAVELNSPFFASLDAAYLRELRHRAEAEGVTLLNIAVDNQGDLSAADPQQRRQAVANHLRWLDVAAALGCNAVRANTGGRDAPDLEERVARCMETFGALAEAAVQRSLHILIENHGGVSGDPECIVRIMRGVGGTAIGALPDFGNFPAAIRYEALAKIAPFAGAVHAKTYAFNAQGEETTIDVGRCVRIIRDAGYVGPFGIEFEGQGDDHEGVLKTKALLERYL